MSTLFEHRTITLPLITSRFVNETFPGWSRIIEACIDMLAAHGGAMDALGVYGGIRFSRRQCDLPREESLLRNTAGESRMGRRTRLLAAWRACRGRSWWGLGGRTGLRRLHFDLLALIISANLLQGTCERTNTSINCFLIIYHTATNYVIRRREVLRHNAMLSKVSPATVGNNIFPKLCPQSIAALRTRNASIRPVTLAHPRSLDTSVQGTAPFCCIL